MAALADLHTCPYKVERNTELGRYLVASRDISERELILHDLPIVCGPADEDTKNCSNQQEPLCLGCHKIMSSSTCNFCSKCGWPVCGVQCENADHHAKNECQVFSGNKVIYPCRHSNSNLKHVPLLHKTILVLRALLLKTRFPCIWENVILKLEHHTEVRHTKPHCSEEDEIILDNLRNFLDDSSFHLEENVIRISGIINVNAFSAMKSDFHGNCVRIVQCIYPEASLLAHSCIPNASWSIDVGNDKLKISIYSAVPIQKGDMITIAYNVPETTCGTLHRLISTEDVAHFICHCRRCLDPSELGTFVSGIKCFDCEANYMLPKFPINPDSIWQCSTCSYEQSVEKIVLLLSLVEDELENIKRHHYPRRIEVRKLENIIRSGRGLMLHENHYILQEVRMRIINMQIHSLEDLTEEELDRLEYHCKVMLRIADVLTPGFNRTRAMLHFFISQGMIRKIDNLKLRQVESDEKDLANLIKTAYGLLNRALLYFNIHSHQSDASASQYVACIQRQLKNLEIGLNS